MSTAVVCISRTMAAGGEEVGKLVAEQLKFGYADDEIIDQAAEMAGVSRDAVAGAERSPGLIARILEGLAATPMITDAGAWTGMAPNITAMGGTGYEELIQEVIRRRAAQGNVVIVAHGGSTCLRGTPSMLRVLVTAPAEVRTQRLAGSMDAQAAKKAVSNSDKQRREFLQRFYQTQEEPTDYDIVVNTEVLGIENAANVVVEAARHR